MRPYMNPWYEPLVYGLINRHGLVMGISLFGGPKIDSHGLIWQFLKMWTFF